MVVGEWRGGQGGRRRVREGRVRKFTCSDEHINSHERYESGMSLLDIRGSSRHMSPSRHKLMPDGRVVNDGG